MIYKSLQYSGAWARCGTECKTQVVPFQELTTLLRKKVSMKLLNMSVLEGVPMWLGVINETLWRKQGFSWALKLVQREHA